MPKWKKDETEFAVGISYDNKRGIQSYIPKPVIDFLGEPDKLIFKIKRGRVAVEAGESK